MTTRFSYLLSHGYLPDTGNTRVADITGALLFSSSWGKRVASCSLKVGMCSQARVKHIRELDLFPMELGWEDFPEHLIHQRQVQGDPKYSTGGFYF